MIPSRGLRRSLSAPGGRGQGSPLVRQFCSTLRIPICSRASSAAYHISHSACIPRPRITHGAAVTAVLVRSRFQSTSTSSLPSTTNPASTATFTKDATTTEAASAGQVTSLDGVTDMTDTSILDMPETLGYLKSLGLDYGWGPTSLVEWTLEHVHVLSGTPWWISIGITAVLFRVALFKPYMDAADNGAKLASVAPITKPLTVKMQDLQRKGDTQGVLALRRDIQIIHKRAGIKIYKSFVPLLQIFLGYGTFVLLRGMSKLPVPAFEDGGALWFTNLALPDAYLALPIATAGVLHWVLRKGGETGVSTMSPGIMKAFSYGMPVLSLAFTWWLPAGLQLSFFVSGVLSAVQATLFRSNPFRQRVGMMPLPEKLNNPFDAQPVEKRYQDRVVVVDRDQYRDTTTATTASSSNGSTAPHYEAPRSAAAATKPTLFSGMKKEFNEAIESVSKAARNTVKKSQESMKEKDGKRSKQDLRRAEAYEKQRREEELRKAMERDRVRKEKRRRQGPGLGPGARPGAGQQ